MYYYFLYPDAGFSQLFPQFVPPFAAAKKNDGADLFVLQDYICQQGGGGSNAFYLPLPEILPYGCKSDFLERINIPFRCNVISIGIIFLLQVVFADDLHGILAGEYHVNA